MKRGVRHTSDVPAKCGRRSGAAGARCWSVLADEGLRRCGAWIRDRAAPDVSVEGGADVAAEVLKAEAVADGRRRRRRPDASWPALPEADDGDGVTPRDRDHPIPERPSNRTRVVKLADREACHSHPSFEARATGSRNAQRQRQSTTQPHLRGRVAGWQAVHAGTDRCRFDGRRATTQR